MNPVNSKRRPAQAAQTLADISIMDYAADIVATWPPLTPAQVARLTALFGGES